MLLVSYNVQQRSHEYDGCYWRPLGSVVRCVVRTDRGVVDLEAEFGVVSVERSGPSAVKLVIEQIRREGPRPVCGVMSATVKDRQLISIKDLPVCGVMSATVKDRQLISIKDLPVCDQQIDLWCRKPVPLRNRNVHASRSLKRRKR